MGETIDKIKALSSKGISIYSWGVYDESEYTDGTSIRFTFYNPTQKTIKYVNISLSATMLSTTVLVAPFPRGASAP